MKPKSILYISLLVATTLFSCKKNTSDDLHQNLDTITENDPDLERKLKYESERGINAIGVDSSITNKFLFKITELQKELNQKLIKSDTLKANLLYEDYSKKLLDNLTDYNFGTSDLLDNYANYESKDIPEKWKIKIEKLKNHHIELVYEGEGFYSFQFKYDYFYNTFKGKVTKDLEQFLYNYAEDDKVLFQADAGIIVPWKEIRLRLLRWEKFIKKYPESRYTPMAKELLGFYLKSYVLGMENTRTFEENTKEIYPEVLQDFKFVLKENPNTFISEFVKDFIEFYTFAAKEYPTDKFNERLNIYVDGILQESLNSHTH